MTERGIRGAQHILAQDAAMGVHERKRSVIADGADVAEMICQPFKLSHERAQIVRARRRFDVQRRLDRPGEGDAVSDGAVAGGAGGKLAARSIVAPAISDSMPLWT